MDVATIEMPVQEARKAFLEYRRAIRARYNKEDEALMRGYRELARGRRLIDLYTVMQNAGIDELGRPKLAICTANQTHCFFTYSGREPIFYFGKAADGNGWRNWRATAHHIKLPQNTFMANSSTTKWNTIRAVVPIVPPQLRPEHDLSNYHILWEAEWVKVPVDPLLLKHLGGPMYAVLAAWDLTPLEQTVLKGRL